MISTINPKLIKSYPKMLCSYSNVTKQLQVIQIVNIPGWFFEQTIFPKQSFIFEAPSDAEVEVYSSHSGQGFLMKKIPGIDLKIELHNT